MDTAEVEESKTFVLSLKRLKESDRIVERYVRTPCGECAMCDIGFTDKCRKTTTSVLYSLKLEQLRVPIGGPDEEGNVSVSAQIGSVFEKRLQELSERSC